MENLVNACMKCKYNTNRRNRGDWGVPPESCIYESETGKKPNTWTKECYEKRKIPTEPQRAYTPTRSTPRGKKQPGGFEGAFENKRILLTPKQVAFIKKVGASTDGWSRGCTSDEYIDSVSEFMSPLSVGAIVTTLREKGMIITSYSRDHGVKVCTINMTDAGIAIYHQILGGEGNE